MKNDLTRTARWLLLCTVIATGYSYASEEEKNPGNAHELRPIPEVILSFLKVDGMLCPTPTDICDSTGKFIERRTSVYPVAIWPNANKSRNHVVEVFENGEKYYLNADSIYLSDQEMAILRDLKTSEYLQFSEHAKLASIKTRRLEEVSNESIVRAAIKRTGPNGVALIEATARAESVGMSLSFTVLNPTKTTIKYVHFTVVGYNAVGDAVYNTFSRGVARTVKGVGPIEPMELATFSWDRFWPNDLVKDYKIKQVKVEFMDGKSKTVSNAQNIFFDRMEAGLLSKVYPRLSKP